MEMVDVNKIKISKDAVQNYISDVVKDKTKPKTGIAHIDNMKELPKKDVEDYIKHSH